MQKSGWKRQILRATTAVYILHLVFCIFRLCLVRCVVSKLLMAGETAECKMQIMKCKSQDTTFFS